MSATPQGGSAARRSTGFTLIELIVVLAIVALLLTVAVPRYFHSVARSREAVLRHDLRSMREAIDKFLADQGRYPATLDELAERRYLRSIPVDPITDRADAWIVVAPPDGAGVIDVRSGAPGAALDGTPYQGW